MATSQGSGKPTARRYSPEENAAAVRMWVKQADIDDGHVAGASTAKARRVRELEPEVRAG